MSSFARNFSTSWPSAALPACHGLCPYLPFALLSVCLWARLYSHPLPPFSPPHVLFFPPLSHPWRSLSLASNPVPLRSALRVALDLPEMEWKEGYGSKDEVRPALSPPSFYTHQSSSSDPRCLLLSPHPAPSHFPSSLPQGRPRS